MEIWKSILGYEGFYEVSNLGNIKSLNYNNTKKENVLMQNIGSNGYFVVSLSKNNIRKQRTVHQIVAESFYNHIPNGNKLVVNHINFIKTDNRLENLEIVTNRENSNKKHIKSTSKYTGVCWHKQHNKWVAQIVINSKVKHLGYFLDELEASRSYDKALKYLLENGKT